MSCYFCGGPGDHSAFECADYAALPRILKPLYVEEKRAMSKPTIQELLDSVHTGGHGNHLAELAERVEAVLKLHWSTPAPDPELGKVLDKYCWHCKLVWPCPTVRALNGEKPR